MQAFLALSRQIQQVATDYDILDAALEHLKREHRWFETNTFVPIGAALPPPTSTLADRKSSFQYETDFHSPLKEQFDSFLREIKLVRTYSNLYNDRSKIGVNEGFAMVNQRDAEVRTGPSTAQSHLFFPLPARAIPLQPSLSHTLLSVASRNNQSWHP